jgi:8-amino-7-oxononanoate synthase
MILDGELDQELADLADRDRLRETRTYAGADRAHPVDIQGRHLISFATNDYLGLASHPALAEASAAAAHETGYGSGASRLVSGEAPAHSILEAKLAAFAGTPAALIFPTGYQANLGVMTTLAGPRDLVVSDAANHASIIDGCRLSRATVSIYRHANAAHAEEALAIPGSFRRRLLVTESVFSMDGDRAPLGALAIAAHAHGAVLVVDEAHAIGSVGPGGRGLAAELGLSPDVLVGTLGKALGALGGFVAGSTPLKRILINRARQFVFTTAAPPALAAAASAAVDLAAGKEGDTRRARALHLASWLRSGLSRAGIETLGRDLIVPIILGQDRHALDVAAALLEMNILAPAIRPPTVPEGTARIRLTVTANHSLEDIDRLVAALASTIGSGGHP